MAAQIFFTPMPTFTGLDGQPMTGGYVYFGQPSQDPRQYPASVYFDQALTIEAAQPVRTNAGYLYRNGAPTQVWLDGPVSVLVLDPAGRQVYYAAQWTDIAVLLPTLAGNAGEAVRINAGATAMEASGFTFPSGTGVLATVDGDETLTNKDFATKFGYGGTGTGGSQTQATSKATGVTLDRVCGTIVTSGSNLAAKVSFTLTNSEIGANDDVRVWRKSGGTDEAYIIYVDRIASGSARITIWNTTGGALAEVLTLGFIVTAARAS